MKPWLYFWTRVQWLASCLILVTATWWWRTFWLKDLNLPDWVMVEPMHFYHFGYFGLLLLGLLAWTMTGWQGVTTLTQDGTWLWLVLIWQLAIWGRIAFGQGVRNHEVAVTESTEFIAVALFITSLTAHPPPLKWAVVALVVGMLLQVGIGMGQVAVQHEIGVERLGQWINLREFDLNPTNSGVSVVGAARYLRPYGVSAHPNLMVAAVMCGLFAAAAWWLTPRTRWLAAMVTMVGWWGLLLSFSRAALGGVLVGGMVTLGLLLLAPSPPAPLPQGERGARGKFRTTLKLYNNKGLKLLVPALWAKILAWGDGIMLAMGLVSVVSGVFVMVYPDLTLGRFRGTVNTEGGEAQTFENFSEASRAVYIEQALDLIPEHLWTGVGRGNFAWESAWLLYCCDDRDLRGDHVHNIYLLALSEVGIIGLGLFMGAILYGMGLIVWRAWHGWLTLTQLALAGCVVAWLAVGWLDHYTWTQFGHQLLFWGVFSLGLGKKIQKATLPT